VAQGPAYGPHGQPGTEGFPSNPDCQTGQTGYPLGRSAVPGQAADSPAISTSDLPGSRGPTTAFWTQSGERRFIDTRVSGRWPNP
jgi:hypothetical protein